MWLHIADCRDGNARLGCDRREGQNNTMNTVAERESHSTRRHTRSTGWPEWMRQWRRARYHGRARAARGRLGVEALGFNNVGVVPQKLRPRCK